MSNFALLVRFYGKVLSELAPPLIILGMTILGIRLDRWATHRQRLGLRRSRWSLRERSSVGYVHQHRTYKAFIQHYGMPQPSRASRLVGGGHYPTNQPTKEQG